MPWAPIIIIIIMIAAMERRGWGRELILRMKSGDVVNTIDKRPFPGLGSLYSLEPILFTAYLFPSQRIQFNKEFYRIIECLAITEYVSMKSNKYISSIFDL